MTYRLPPNLISRLSKPERELLMGLCCGLDLKEIAEVMRFHSEGALAMIAHRMYKTLEVKTPGEACYLWGKHEDRLQAD